MTFTVKIHSFTVRFIYTILSLDKTSWFFRVCCQYLCRHMFLQLATDAVADFAKGMGISNLEEIKEFSILASRNRGKTHGYWS